MMGTRLEEWGSGEADNTQKSRANDVCTKKIEER